MHARPVVVLFSVLSALASPGAVSGQNALGDGTALDRPLRVGDTINRPVQNFEAELRFRNAIVTGNAPNGLGFRGDVGYVAPGEFFGALGSDDSFAFRRDSAISGLAGLGLRGTEALQLQAALSTGAPSPGSGALANDYRYARTGYLSRGAELRRPDEAISNRLSIEPIRRRNDPVSPDFDDRGLDLWTVRSPAAYIATQSLRSSLMGTRENEQGATIGLEASPLRGVREIPLGPRPEQVNSEPLSTRIDLSAPPPGSAPEPAEEETTPDTADAQASPDTYEGLLDRLESLAPSPLTRDEEAPDESTDPESTPAPADWRGRLDALRRQLVPGLERSRLGESDADGEEKKRPSGVDEETVRMLLESAGRIAEFTPPSADGPDPYATHITVGQRLLKDRRYFDAETRFARALANRPGDAMASAGRVHAQLGAGLYLSAALNLRDLLRTHPELLSSKFDASLLPEPRRLASIVGELEKDLQGEQRLGSAAALSLAYLGYQTGDRGAIESGLAFFPTLSDLPDDATEEQRQNAQLADLLRAVWLDSDESPDDETD